MDINIFSASTIATMNILIYVYLDMYTIISRCFIPSAITGPSNACLNFVRLLSSPSKSCAYLPPSTIYTLLK